MVGDGKGKRENGLVRYSCFGLGCSEDTAEEEEEKTGAGVAGGQASSANNPHLPPLSIMYQSRLVPLLDVLALFL